MRDRVSWLQRGYRYFRVHSSLNSGSPPAPMQADNHQYRVTFVPDMLAARRQHPHRRAFLYQPDCAQSERILLSLVDELNRNTNDSVEGKQQLWRAMPMRMTENAKADGA